MRGLIYFLIFAALAFDAEALENTVYIETSTVDGVPVEYVAQSSEQMIVSRQSVAYTIYSKTGAFIYYNAELFGKLKKLSRFLIIEHERAHHYLGHTLSTRDYRDRKKSIPPRLSYKKETDADCESGYRASEIYGERISAKEIYNAMRAIYLAEGGDPEKSPDWLTRRSGKVTTCFEGLIDRPEAMDYHPPYS